MYSRNLLNSLQRLSKPRYLALSLIGAFGIGMAIAIVKQSQPSRKPEINQEALQRLQARKQNADQINILNQPAPSLDLTATPDIYSLTDGTALGTEQNAEQKNSTGDPATTDSQNNSDLATNDSIQPNNRTNSNGLVNNPYSAAGSYTNPARFSTAADRTSYGGAKNNPYSQRSYQTNFGSSKSNQPFPIRRRQANSNNASPTLDSTTTPGGLVPSVPTNPGRMASPNRTGYATPSGTPGSFRTPGGLSSNIPNNTASPGSAAIPGSTTGSPGYSVIPGSRYPARTPNNSTTSPKRTTVYNSISNSTSSPNSSGNSIPNNTGSFSGSSDNNIPGSTTSPNSSFGNSMPNSTTYPGR